MQSKVQSILAPAEPSGLNGHSAVEQADIACSNGWVHMVSRVAIAPAYNFPAPMKHILQLLCCNDLGVLGFAAQDLIKVFAFMYCIVISVSYILTVPGQSLLRVRLAQSTSYLSNIATGAILSGLDKDFADERSEFVSWL